MPQSLFVDVLVDNLADIKGENLELVFEILYWTKYYTRLFCDTSPGTFLTPFTFIQLENLNVAIQINFLSTLVFSPFKKSSLSLFFFST